ncbi:MAG: 3-keto-disaccharide hydrolase [Flavisolibacter sp.]
MNKSILFVLACFIISCGNNKTSMNSTNESQAAADDGWISLFDGKTTNGWHCYGKDHVGPAWKVENGAFHLDAESKKTAKAEGGDLVTNQEFENFDLKIDWRISPKGNSGIIFYVKEDPSKYGETYNTGLEMQVLDNGTPTVLGHPDGKLYSHRAGDLYDLLAAKEAEKLAGQWNQSEIIANKGKLDFYLNGIHTLSTTMWNDTWRQMIAISKFKDMKDFGTFKKGKIALQDHGDEVWYRNIKIKKL